MYSTWILITFLSVYHTTMYYEFNIYSTKMFLVFITRDRRGHDRINNYLCNQCLSQLKVRIPLMARCTRKTLCEKVCQWLATGRWFSPDNLVSSTNTTDRHDITEILFNNHLNDLFQKMYQSVIIHVQFELTQFY